MQDIRIAALEEGGPLDEVVGRALQTLVRQESSSPALLRLLMRGYVATGREDLEAAIGPGLARALDACGYDVERGARSEWILLFVDAAALSPEERLKTAAASLLVSVAHDWPAVGDVGSAVRSIDSCLRAVDFIPDDEARRFIAAAIDELERIVGPLYRPGEGMAHVIGDRSGARGSLRDQVNTAAALLTAYEITGRLPYSMLAEELMQFAQRLQPEPVSQRPGAVSRENFVGSCEAVRVLSRLILLHEDADYQQAAVIAPEANYAARSEDLLRWLADVHREQDVSAAAEFGIALCDWLTFR